MPRDPTAFAWPEASPDGGSIRLCKPGHYIGTYQCTVAAPPLAPGAGLILSGPVDLRLSESQEGEFLIVSGGTLKTSAGPLQLDSKIVGKLSCQTGTFQGALQDAQLSIVPLPPGGTITGTLDGAFAPANASMDGSWNFQGDTAFPGYSCVGPWTIAWDGE